jgi:hypothetical protein
MRLLVAMCTLLSAASSSGAEMRYGAESLPYLSRKATRVVVVKDALLVWAGTPASEASGAPEVRVYRSRVLNTVYASGDERVDSVTFVVPKAVDLQTAAAYSGRILFLGKLPDGEELPKSDGHIFRLISGHYGALQFSSERDFAIREFCRIMPERDKKVHNERMPEARLGWCGKYLASKDGFLQRSVVMELGRFTSDPAAVELLSKALDLPAEASDTNTKWAAITALGASSSDATAGPLMKVIIRDDLPLDLREHAVTTAASSPAGRSELRRWVVGRESRLARFARAQLEHVQTHPAD